MRRLALLVTHVTALLLGVALGIYLLPILIAAPPPDAAAMAQARAEALHRGTFRRDLADSDWLHWGEGEVHVGPRRIALEARLSPGPDYRLYLAPRFIDTEAAFHAARAELAAIGPVRGFAGAILAVPADVDVARYDTVVIWCEAFGQFITAARYRTTSPP